MWLELLNRTLELEGKARDRDAKLELLRYQAQELAALAVKAGESSRSARSTRGWPTAASSPPAARRPWRAVRERSAAPTRASRARSRRCARWRASMPGSPRCCRCSRRPRSRSARAARELEHYRDTLDIDAGRQDEVERRLAAIEDLARKHRVTPFELPERSLGADRRA